MDSNEDFFRESITKGRDDDMLQLNQRAENSENRAQSREQSREHRVEKPE